MVRDVPEGFPWNTVQVQRALVAITLVKPGMLANVLQELYHLAWVESKDVHGYEQIRPVLIRMLGDTLAQEVLDRVGKC